MFAASQRLLLACARPDAASEQEQGAEGGDELDRFVQRLFTSTEVQKIGFAFDGDLRMLRKSWGASYSVCAPLVDGAQVALGAWPELKAHDVRGMSSLCKTVLGLGLDKVRCLVVCCYTPVMSLLLGVAPGCPLV